jgi:hypothetical protein
MSKSEEPKKRGRPRKIQPLIEEVIPAKKRGRPKKADSLKVIEAVEIKKDPLTAEDAQNDFYDVRTKDGRAKRCKITGQLFLSPLQERWKYACMYYPEIGLEMVEFFEERAQDPTKFPTFEGFAALRGMTRSLLCKWAKDERKPEFARYYDICLSIQADTTITRGMTGFANARFAEVFGRIFLKWTEKGDEIEPEENKEVTGFDIRMIGAAVAS